MNSTLRCLRDVGRRCFLGNTQLRWRCHSSVPALRLVQFEHEPGKRRVGAELVRDGETCIVDVCEEDEGIPTDMRALLELGEDMLARVSRVALRGTHVYPQKRMRLLAPIHNPEKIICVGMNYTDHCAELDLPVPKEPIIFSKFPSTITGPAGDIRLPPPSLTKEVDFEVELAAVIGKAGYQIAKDDAMSYIVGFTVAHDVSARDWQMGKNNGQWLLGKTFDTFCPLGPSLVTTAALSDPHRLNICCRVNGKTMQDGNTSRLVHKTPAIVSYISRFVTLQPGDLILTGTPPGVGFTRKPPIYLKKGDVVECEIEEIGSICNQVV